MTDEQDSVIEARLSVRCIIRDQIKYYHKMDVNQLNKNN